MVAMRAGWRLLSWLTHGAGLRHAGHGPICAAAAAAAATISTISAVASAARADSGVHAEPVYAQGKDFAVFDARGGQRDWAAVERALRDADVVLLGEVHDDPVAHALERRLWRAALQLGSANTCSGASTSTNAVRSPSESSSSPPPTQQQAHLPSFNHAPLAQEQDSNSNQRPVARRRMPVLSLEMFDTDVQVMCIRCR